MAPLQKALSLWLKLPGVQLLLTKGIIHANGCASNTQYEKQPFYIANSTVCDNPVVGSVHGYC